MQSFAILRAVRAEPFAISRAVRAHARSRCASLIENPCALIRLDLLLCQVNEINYNSKSINSKESTRCNKIDVWRTPRDKTRKLGRNAQRATMLVPAERHNLCATLNVRLQFRKLQDIHFFEARVHFKKKSCRELHGEQRKPTPYLSRQVRQNFR